MSADLQQSVSPSLSPRAGIAMLTLQIRATLQEAAEVEAQYVDVDHEAAKRQLRERLEPLIQERTRSFADAIDAARDEAARTVAAAHEEAARRRAEAERIAAMAAAAEAERVAAAEAEAAREAEAQARVDAEAAIDAMAIDATPDWAESTDDDVTDTDLDTAAVLETDEVVAPDEVLAPQVLVTADDPAPSPFARQTLPPPPPQQINVSIDAEAFAKVFATVFASIVEQRLQHAPPAPVYMPYAIPAPTQAAPAKQGFWRHARHPDVLLLGLATAIVLVVLAAWLA